MPSLTHVSMLTKEHGWRRITAEEAAKIFPSGTVSAHSKLFMCELCGQYVTLTDGNIRDRYFKHSAYERSKDCPERTFANGSSNFAFNPRNFELPIKLSLKSEADFSLLIGFLFVPRDILDQHSSKEIQIFPQNSPHTFTYLFERLSERGLTYLSVGDIPAKSYRIQCEDSLHIFWPEKVTGVDGDGSVFSFESGIKLNYNSDVKVGEKYYLLRRGELYGLYRYPHVNVKQLCKKQIGLFNWYIYEIEATAYEEDAARFFLDLHCQLRDRPLKFQMLWPLYEENTCLIKLNKDNAFLYVNGRHEDISMKSYPLQNFTVLSNKNESSVVQIYCDSRRMLFTAGRTKVMDYLYFWKDSLAGVTDRPIVNVCDIYNNPIEAGVLNTLPKKKMLVIQAPYDGVVIISKGTYIKEKYMLSADQALNVTLPGYGTKIDITQGLDVVWSVAFCKKDEELLSDDDEMLLKKLNSFSGQMVQINHNLGAVADSFKEYPQTKKWIYRQIRSGEISYDALKYLEQFLAGKRIKF